MDMCSIFTQNSKDSIICKFKAKTTMLLTIKTIKC